MLELKNIRKTYKVGEIETKALDGISLSFREREFVAILGPSGSGKTTCLNIIGGLDRYDSGDMTIKGKSTKDFRDRDWDAYRNNSIGFVFQSYNLINHLSIVANVELGMTLSGVSAREKHLRALDVLERVGLKEHLHKKPNQLSGGQMQRVAIARALANDPEVLLCDEPTGALDTATSVQILDLIKEVSRDRLVIMVTHNSELAERYADRIIRFSDGKTVSDSNPFSQGAGEQTFSLKKTSMSFFTALRLSANNLKTKKGRTFLTAFASSIGIIGIALILSLSTGFQIQIDKYQQDALAEFPIIISQTAVNIDEETMAERRQEMLDFFADKEYEDTDEVKLYDPSKSTIRHKNRFTDEFMEYLDNIDPAICGSIGYTRIVGMNALRKTESGVIPVTFAGASGSPSGGEMMGGSGLSSYPTPKTGSDSYLKKNYDVLCGDYPQSATDLVLIIDTRNRINVDVLSNLGFETEGVDSIKLDEIVGTELKLVQNNDYYIKTPFGNYLPSSDYEGMYDSADSVTLRICGVLRQKEDVSVTVLGTGIAYSDDLAGMVIERAIKSDIVAAQRGANYNIITMEPVDEDAKELILSFLGGNAAPFAIFVYPTSFENKDAVLSYLDRFNAGRNEEDVIIYTDLAERISTMTSSIMDGVTIVLLAFAAISLVVGLIMICIITYTSVLERTVEIGILRALGARKKDITRVFDAETCILGVLSGVLGIVIARLLMIPANIILFRLTSLERVARLRPEHAIFLIIVSTVLTMLGGHIPALMASRKDAVEALRSE